MYAQYPTLIHCFSSFMKQKKGPHSNPFPSVRSFMKRSVACILMTYWCTERTWSDADFQPDAIARAHTANSAGWCFIFALLTLQTLRRWGVP